MWIALETERLCELLVTQIRNNFLLEAGEEGRIKEILPGTLLRVEHCFSASKNKYYRREGKTYFNPYHSGQYCVFLYFLANSLFDEDGGTLLCDKLYCLNKMLNGLDLFYEVQMPDVFFTDHPVGSVLGRAEYGSHFSFMQNCTVGNNKGNYPVFGANVRMFSGARVLGQCQIGSNVLLSSGSYVKDTDVPDNSIVFGQSPDLVFKPRKEIRE